MSDKDYCGENGEYISKVLVDSVMTRKICRLSPLFLCDFKLSKFFFFTLTLSPLVLKSSTSISFRPQQESVSSSQMLSYLESNNAGNDRAGIKHSSRERLEICVEDLMAGRFKQYSASESLMRKSSESLKNVRDLSDDSANNGEWNDLTELEKRDLIILFAQPEAKCLEEFVSCCFPFPMEFDFSITISYDLYKDMRQSNVTSWIYS